MCRNIKQLRSAERAPSAEEIELAALQYIRKVSGYRAPSRANQQVFAKAVAEVAAATEKLLEGLVTHARTQLGFCTGAWLGVSG